MFSKGTKTKTLKFVKNLLKIGANNIDITNLINQKSIRYGLTPFSLAVQNDVDIEIIKLLHDEYKADINVTANDKLYASSPLFMAVQNNNTQITEYLISKNADCNAKLSERDHITPLFVAAEKGYKEIVSLLLYKCNNLVLTSEDDENDDG